MLLRRSLRAIVPLALVLGLAGGLACTEEEEIPDSCDDQQPTLALDNQTGNTIDVIHFYACDMSEQSDYPLPPPGLATGESVEIPFPGPGCWIMQYEGDGCLNDPVEQTDPLDCDAVWAWTAGLDEHICAG